MDTFIPINCPVCQRLVFYLTNTRSDARQFIFEALHPDWKLHECSRADEETYYNAPVFQKIALFAPNDTPLPQFKIFPRHKALLRKVWGIIIHIYHNENDALKVKVLSNNLNFLTVTAQNGSAMALGNLIQLGHTKRVSEKEFRIKRISFINFPPERISQLIFHPKKQEKEEYCEVIVSGEEQPSLEAQMSQIIHHVHTAGGQVVSCYPLLIEAGKHRRKLVFRSVPHLLRSLSRLSVSTAVHINFWRQNTMDDIKFHDEK